MSLAAATLAAGPGFADQPSDAWITTKAKTELLTDDIVDGIEIHVDTYDGRVTLYGKAATEAERSRAEKEVRSIDGVTDVRNLIVVVPEAVREDVKVGDEAIERSIAAALESDPVLAQSSVRVKSVDGGVVLLSGKASSLTAHQRALTLARRAEGVHRVASEIRSPDELADEEIRNDGKAPADLQATATDAWITTKAKVQLMSTTGIPAMSVNVDTVDGVVTLFGTVPTALEKQRAEAAIRELEGVTRVENELQVVPNVAAGKVARSDDELTKAVRQRLDERTSLSDSALEIETANGVVRLTGSVDESGDRLTALTVARNTPGVKSVVDDIQSGAAR
ncbi:MAG: BON domain-containing protein [Myxococcota bacterium]